MASVNHRSLFALWLQRAALPLCMSLALASGHLFGAERAQRKVVRIPCSNFSRLMVLDEDNNPVSGYAYDYIQAIATYAKWDVRYVYCESFAESVNKLLAGEVDLFYDISYTEDRAKIILYPEEPMGNEYYYLYASDENTSITTDDYASMNGKSVGVTSGTVQIGLLEEWCKKRNVDFKLVEFKAIPDKEAALVSGKIDLDLEVSMLARRNFSAVERIGSSAYYLVANKERPDLIDDINAALDKLLNSDLYYLSKLEERYFSDTVLSHNLTFDEKKWIAGHNVMRVGLFDNYLPFSARDANGEPTGVGIEVIQEIIRALKLEDDLEVEYVFYAAQQDGYRAVESGEIDLVFPAYISNLVKHDYRIVGGKVLAALACDIVYPEDRWKGKVGRIGVNRKNMMQYYYSVDSYPNAEIVFYDGIDKCLKGLLDGTSDVTFLNGLRTDALLSPAKYRPLGSMRAKNSFTFRMAFAEDNVGLLLLMDRGVTMLDPDFVNKASYSYVGQIYTFSIMDFLQDHIVPVIGTVAVLVALVAALVVYWISNRKLAGMNQELMDYSKTIEQQRLQEFELRKQLEEALQMAQDANHAKTMFLSNMSHDIRTPMNAIIGSAGLAESNINDKERVHDCLATIEQSSAHLLSLINDILAMSRIESGKMTLNEKAESLPEMLHVLNDIVQTDIRAKRHTFFIDAAGVRDEFVYCDKMHLNQVLLNLISNAVKYTPPNGTISLRVMQKPSAKEGYGTYEFRCQDNGIGMSEDFVKTIFDPFTREGNSTVSGIQGTGLGMAITKNLVEMMGGVISVVSRKGEGSEFIVSVDFRIADGTASRREADEVKAIAPISLEGKRVLLVDDVEINRKVGLLQLQQKGMVVDTAANGQIAVDKIRKNGVGAYDFVLMDVQMPVMDGYETTSEIRKLPGGNKLKIIAYSANAFDEDRKKSINAGMDGHIAKPLRIDELIKELKRLIV